MRREYTKLEMEEFKFAAVLLGLDIDSKEFKQLTTEELLQILGSLIAKKISNA